MVSSYDTAKRPAILEILLVRSGLLDMVVDDPLAHRKHSSESRLACSCAPRSAEACWQMMLLLMCMKTMSVEERMKIGRARSRSCACLKLMH